MLTRKYLLPHPPMLSPPPQPPMPPSAVRQAQQPHDYLYRPVEPDSKIAPGAWDAAFARLPPRSTTQPAAVIYLNIGPWPPWIRFLLRSAAANSLVAFYFVGRQLNVRGCAHCRWLPMDAAGLLQRLHDHLDVPMRFTQDINLQHYRKLCDLKPLWPALLPELSARHEWIGFADTDILFGNLTHEVLHLSESDELLVPSEFYPHPLANGNFLMMRANRKMIFAFRRSPVWRRILRARDYSFFDEWNNIDPPGTMMAVYQDMFLAGELLARPTTRVLIQDVVMQRGRSYPSIAAWGAQVSLSLHACGGAYASSSAAHLQISLALQVNLSWRHGGLFAERHGICICPNDVIAHSIALTVCPECLMLPGQALRGIVTHRHLQALGFHFQDWKKQWAKSEKALFSAHDGSTRPASVVDPVPKCRESRQDFGLRPSGFTCEA